MYFIHHHLSSSNKSNAHPSSFGSFHSLSSPSAPCTVVRYSTKRSLLIDSAAIKSQSKISFLPLIIGPTSSNGSSDGNPAVPISILTCSGFKIERLIFKSISNRTNSKQLGLSKKGRPADAQPKLRQGLDIRTLFQRAETRNREIRGQQKRDSSVAIIDLKRLLLRK